MAVAQLKRGREKVMQNRHPWLFSGAIQRVEGEAAPGDVVDVASSRGDFLARGYYNPRSQIRIRILTWEREAVDEAFWRQRLERAIDRRRAIMADPGTTAYRLVFAESDGLPGLIVDRYGEWLVLQALTLGIEVWKETLAELLYDLVPCRGVYERSDVDVRGHEGLPAATGLLVGEAPDGALVVRENDLQFRVDTATGHKTGFYLDQRANRQIVADYCEGAEMLNVFAYTGGFGVYAGAHGARRIVNLDSSADALKEAEANMALNGLGEMPQEYVQGDAFEVLRTMRDAGEQFDVVVLDPPKFAFSKSQVQAATRGYKDINMLGMDLVRPGGILCTFSCSGLVSEDLFQKVLFGASVDVDREVRVLRRLAQGPDHPVLLTFPEGAYLKGFVCRVE